MGKRRVCWWMLVGLVLAVQIARGQELTLIHTTDFCGVMIREGSGLAELARTVSELESELPNPFWVHVGGTLAGSPEAEIADGQLHASFLVENRCVAWVPGVEDWGSGPGAWKGAFEKLAGRVLVAGLDPQPAGTLPCQIVVKNGVRVALIGLMPPQVSDWMSSEYWGGGRQISPEETMKVVLARPEVASAHVRILLVPATIEGAQGAILGRLVERFPSLDLIVGGGPGRGIAGMRAGKILFTKSSGDLRDVGIVRLRWNPHEKKLSALRSELVTVSGDGDPAWEASLTKDRSILRTALDRKIGETVSPLSMQPQAPLCWPTAARVLELAVQEAWQKIGQPVQGVVAGPLHPVDIPAGPVTQRDLLAIVPSGLRSVRIEVSAEAMRSAMIHVPLLEGGVPARLWTGELLRVQPGKGVVGTTATGERPADQRQPLALLSSDAAGAGGAWPRLAQIVAEPLSKASLSPFTIAEALRDYISAHTPIQLEPLPAWSLLPALPTTKPAPALPKQDPPRSPPPHKSRTKG